jgi:signal transduction histidine kinase
MVDRNVASVDEHELQACVRDLVALATMPAWWIGRPPMAIAESLRDLLVSMLRADTVSVQLHDRFVWGSQLATARGKPSSIAPETNGGAHHEPYDRSPRSDVALRRASLSIGLDGELGRIEVSAVRPTFPERTELLLMQVAANEVSVALQHAELLIRHERAEQALRARASQQAVVAHLGLRALRESSLDTILEESVAAIRETMRADHCEIFELSADARVLLLRAADGWPPGSLDLEDVLVDDIVLASEELIRPMLEAKHLHFTHRSMDGNLMVRADRPKLQQILVNLLSNATKFTDPGGHVSVECEGMATTIQIHVADTGCGIPPDRLDTVFQPFVQVDGGRQPQWQGTGLGLAISRDFAVGMGGQLLAESQLGRGSTFTIVLPRITS